MTKLYLGYTLTHEDCKIIVKRRGGIMKNLLPLIVLTLTVLLTTETSYGQQDPMYSMYMFNGLSVNPAYAGSRDRVSMTALYRHQWTGLEGAPKTAVLVAHGPLLNDNLGIGLSIVSDNISIFNTISITASYAYRIKIKDHGRLALGMSATFRNDRARWGNLTLQDETDVAFTEANQNVMSPNFGAGVYYQSERFYVGVSVPHFLNNSLSENVTVEGVSNTARQWKHYFYTAGAIFKISNNVKIKPSVLFKQVQNAPFQADLNVAFVLKEALMLGVSYRTGDAVVGMLEYQFKKGLRVGYAYDATLTELRNYSGGSHEILVGYEFMKKDAYLTPRRMSYF